MYNGTISLGDAADLNILKQQVELIAALNGQLKEFASLKSNVSAVFDIIKMKTLSVTEAAKAVKGTALTGCSGWEMRRKFLCAERPLVALQREIRPL